jgi:hypothetical protein
MKLAAYLAVLTVAAFSAALANEPQPPAVQPAAAATPAPNATPSSSATPASSTTPVAEVPAEALKPAPTAEKAAAPNPAITDAQIKQMRGRGYKPVLRNGTMVFCHAERQLGSHFEVTRCNTIDELNRAEQSGKEYVNSIQQQGSPTQFKGP